MRRRAKPSSQPLHDVIGAVWDRHDDEAYRQDQSHWRGVGRWDEQTWLGIGRSTMRRIEDLSRTTRRPDGLSHDPVVLEWGPGGGSNLFALAAVSPKLYGVDISAKNLDEARRVLSEKLDTTFVPVHLVGEPEAVLASVDEFIDVFLSTAVFQHFPTKDYGRRVLTVVEKLLAPDGVGLVQIRYDDGNPKYAPKAVERYGKQHLTANSYGLSEFWDLLVETGLQPTTISHVSSKNNYATFFFTKRHKQAG